MRNDRSFVYETNRTPKWKDKLGVLVSSSRQDFITIEDQRDEDQAESLELVLAPDESFKFFKIFSMPEFTLCTMPTTDLYSFRMRTRGFWHISLPIPAVL
jgi:hypothetical protein